MVTLLLPLEIVPVKVPLNDPAPVPLERVIVVAEVTLAGFPFASCDWTVTLKGVPAVPVEGTVVYASLVAVAGLNAIRIAPHFLFAPNVATPFPVEPETGLMASPTPIVPPVLLEEYRGLRTGVVPA